MNTPRGRKMHNESGVILITVIAIVLILTVITLSIVGTNVSQMKSGMMTIENLQAEELAKGAMARMHQLQVDCFTAGNCCTTDSDCAPPQVCLAQVCIDEEAQYTLNGRVFTVTYIDDPAEGYNQTDQYTVRVDY